MPDAEDLTIDGGQAGDSQPYAVRQFTARFRQAATIMSNVCCNVKVEC